MRQSRTKISKENCCPQGLLGSNPGLGALYFKKGTLLDPLIVGAAQEYGKRAGTENVSCIVGLGEATALIPKWRAKNEELKELRDYFVEKIGERIPRAAFNGAPENRLPNNANIRFDGVNSAELLLLLDQEGIAVSAGSACESKAQTDSHTLKAIRLSAAQARSRAMAAQLHRVVARYGTGRLPGFRCLSAHRCRRRSRRLGQIRSCQNAGLSLGHPAGTGKGRTHHSLRQAQGRAGLEGGPGRIALIAAASDRHPGRFHRWL